jgi:hypothetical protein
MSDAHQEGQAGEEGTGMAIGVRIFEVDGEMYLAEAEITNYVDDPNALGATLVFHSLDGIDPLSDAEDEDDTMWHVDIDDVLTRPEDAPVREQFQAIIRQLAGLSEPELRDLLREAREQEGMDEEEE